MEDEGREDTRFALMSLVVFVSFELCWFRDSADFHSNQSNEKFIRRNFAGTHTGLPLHFTIIAEE